MSKKYRDLLQSISEAKLRKGQEIEGDDDEQVLQPRADGERDFAKSQLPVHVGGPMDRPTPTKNSDNVANARSMKPTTPKGNAGSGDRTFPRQGTSILPDKSGFKWQRSVTPANNRGERGDAQIVRLSPSAVKMPDNLGEDVTDQLERIADGGAPGDVITSDGHVTVIHPTGARSLLETFRQLNPQNAEKFRASINEGPAGLLKMMKFVGV